MHTGKAREGTNSRQQRQRISYLNSESRTAHHKAANPEEMNPLNRTLQTQGSKVEKEEQL